MTNARKRLVLAKAESTYGTDSSPAAANAIPCASVSINALETETIENALVRETLGNNKQVTVTAHKSLDVEIAMALSGTAGTRPAFADLLLACGVGETINAGTSVVYTPADTGFSSASLYYHEDDQLHKLVGARGTASLSFSAKSFPMLKTSFKGLYEAVSESALPNINWSAVSDPVAINNENTTTVSLFGHDLVLEEFSWDFGVDVAYRNLPGSEAVRIKDRKPTASITFETPALADWDIESAVKNDSTGTFNIVHGKVAGKIMQIGSAKVQIANFKMGESDGIRTTSLDLIPLPGGEIKLTLK